MKETSTTTQLYRMDILHHIHTSGTCRSVCESTCTMLVTKAWVRLKTAKSKYHSPDYWDHNIKGIARGDNLNPETTLNLSIFYLPNILCKQNRKGDKKKIDV